MGRLLGILLTVALAPGATVVSRQHDRTSTSLPVLVLSAPVSADVRNVTTYVAVVTTGSPARERGQASTSFLNSATARAVLAATGAE